jgi:hypothetical protein
VLLLSRVLSANTILVTTFARRVFLTVQVVKRILELVLSVILPLSTEQWPTLVSVRLLNSRIQLLNANNVTLNALLAQV